LCQEFVRSTCQRPLAWIGAFSRNMSLGRWSDAHPVVEVNDTASEAVFVQEFELDANVIRQCALSATDDNRAEEQVAFVDQACGYRFASELCTANRDVAGRGLLELPDRCRIEIALDPRPRAR
jgi:hypothetical protein